MKKDDDEELMRFFVERYGHKPHNIHRRHMSRFLYVASCLTALFAAGAVFRLVQLYLDCPCANEMAAEYIFAGVTIVALVLFGKSMHTSAWRMSHPAEHPNATKGL